MAPPGGLAIYWKFNVRSSEKGVVEPVALSDHQRFLLTSLIDAPYYSQQAGTNFGALEELAEHFLHSGGRHGFDPSPTFRSSSYLDAMPELRAAGENPFVHYLFKGVGEQLLNRAFEGLSKADIGALRARFDADFYARENPDVNPTANDLFIHYLTVGCTQLRDPSPFFSTGRYLDLNPDVRACGINPYRHWVLHGAAEGRPCGKPAPATLRSWSSLEPGQQEILTRMFCVDYFRSNAVSADCEDYHRGLTLAKRLCSGAAEANRPTPSFDAVKYANAHPEIRDTGQLPFLHYLFDLVGEEALRALFVVQSPVVVQALCDHFETVWYLYNHPEVEASGEDALIHYMTVGWCKNFDPSRDFSTRAYGLRYTDVADAGVIPFLHWVEFGKAEGRLGASSATNFRNRPYAPSITAVLINDDVNPLTPECVAAVANQSFAGLQFMVVGAPLSDACQAALAGTGRKGASSAIGYVAIDQPAPLLKHIERASEQATSDLLWVVQGQGIHDFEFLARLTSSFSDGSVQLGFGRRLAPEDLHYNVPEDDLARQMQGWMRHETVPAALWFPHLIRSEQPVADPSSFLWRRRSLDDSVWRRAADYDELGLAYLFLQMASGGQVATVRDAIVRIAAVSTKLPARPSADDRRRDVARLSADVQSFWPRPGLASGSVLEGDRPKRHVLLVTHGIFAGGAENLPIQLANALMRRGVTVSMLIFRTEINAEMRATLDPGVSLYEADWVLEYGCERFVRDIGCSLIHSHGVVGEMFFFRYCDDMLSVPYIATLHGSYEASSTTELPEALIAKIVRRVDLFIYTADKNLGPLLRHDVRPEQLTKMINAMPVDDTPFPRSRAELGIADDALLFTLVARGVREKGWVTAISAFKLIQERNPHRQMHLCLVGEGDEPDRLKPLHAHDPSISFLGFQLRIHGLYRLTDVAIVPTRFAGESFPLCVIQALQASIPVVATDIGEIASMLKVNGVTGGIVVEDSEIDDEFTARFADAMQLTTDDKYRKKLSSGASVLAKAYDMTTFTEHYIKLYEDVLCNF